MMMRLGGVLIRRQPSRLMRSMAGSMCRLLRFNFMNRRLVVVRIDFCLCVGATGASGEAATRHQKNQQPY
jgi:hypothetical protein